jgi:hypothetical protein
MKLHYRSGILAPRPVYRLYRLPRLPLAGSAAAGGTQEGQTGSQVKLPPRPSSLLSSLGLNGRSKQEVQDLALRTVEQAAQVGRPSRLNCRDCSVAATAANCHEW